MKEIKRIIDNHIYILKLIRKGSGWFPLFLIFFSVLRGFNTFFMTTWIYQYVINALQKGEKLTKIAVTAGVVFVFTLAYNALLQFKNAMMEIESGKIEKELQKILQKKALSVDLGCFDFHFLKQNRNARRNGGLGKLEFPDILLRNDNVPFVALLASKGQHKFPHTADRA